MVSIETLEDVGYLISKPKVGAAGKTGSWRNLRPVVDEKVCKLCNVCILYCPENVIEVVNDRLTIDYEYCKGCGICSNVCISNAIKMVEEVTESKRRGGG